MTDTPIVVGYDGRAGSQAALDEALRLAEELGPRPWSRVLVRADPRLGGEVADLARPRRERGRAVLQEAVDRAAGSGVAVDDGDVIERPPADGLLAVADERDAQMIVVGSTGEGPLRGILIGSTPYKLLHLSTRPVLVVRAA